MSKRPDYARIRRFLAKGGVLQRETPFPNSQQVIWHAAARDGRTFHADTCAWLASRDFFTLDGEAYALVEDPTHPGIFKCEGPA